MKIKSCPPTPTTDPIDERYELQQMSGALPADEIHILPNDDPSAVIDETTTIENDSFQQSRVAPETSLEALERTHHLTQNPPKTSLEVLECAHHKRQISTPDSNLSIHNDIDPPKEFLPTSFSEEASRIPLPSTSSAHSSSSHPSLEMPLALGSIEEERSIPHFSESYNLWQKNKIRLSGQFPHFQSVRSRSRHDKADITIYDYADSVLQDRQHLAVDFRPERDDSRDSKLDECHQFLCSTNASSRVDTRLVVLEDLGSSLISLLGATFDLSPEFFEEHLHLSNYSAHRDPETAPSTWRTSNLQKNYVSFVWSRPGESWVLDIEPGKWNDLYNSNPVETIRQFNSKNGQSSNMFHNFVAKTNILRGETEMSIDPAGQLPERAPCGWRERATVCNLELDRLKYVILLIDPIPIIEQTIAGVSEAMRPVKVQGGEEGYRPSNCKYRSKHVNAPEHREDWCRQTEILSLFTQMHCRTPWNLDYLSLFRSPTARSEAQDIFSQLSPFQSTAEALQEWLVSASVKEVGGYKNRLGPGSMIFRIAHQDTMGFLRLIRSALEEIDLASSDVDLQQAALHWRRRLDEFRFILIDIESSLHSFVEFLNANGSPPSIGFLPKLDTNPIEYLLHDAVRAIELHKERLSQVYSSLTSKTQISDSHRSIAEAQTVTRLTELAFLFIPLSFATSIFGMQFISGSTSATTYIAVALALTSGSYLLRFSIHRTTEQRLNIRRSISDRISAYAKLRAGSHIPTATFFRWLAHIMKRRLLRYWKLSFLGAVTLVMLTIPLPVIWTSSLNTGLKIALSCFLISIPTFLVGFYFWARYSMRRRRSRASSPDA